MDRSRATSCSMAPRSCDHSCCESSIPCMQAASTSRATSKICCRNSRKILGDVLLRIGVVLASEFAHKWQTSGLPSTLRIRETPYAPAHGHAWKTGGVSSPPTRKFVSTVTTGAKVLRENDDTHAVGQCGAHSFRLILSGGRLSTYPEPSEQEQQRYNVLGIHFDILQTRLR